MTFFTRRTEEVPCTVEVSHRFESLHAHVRFDNGAVVNPGDEVLRPLVRPLAGAAPTPAPPAPAPDGFLGETLAGLGAPTDRGLWLATGLVATPTPGRIETASGGALEVELRPTGAAPSAGSQFSLQAMQALGLPLSQLATLRVYAR